MTVQSQTHQVSAVLAAVRNVWGSAKPRFGIILGTGAGQIADAMSIDCRIDYVTLPGFPQSTAIGHGGYLLCGRLGRESVVALQGRFHLYEGYSIDQIAVPIRLLARLGVTTLLVSNASGGINPTFRSGDLMVIESHLDLTFRRQPDCQEPVPGRASFRIDSAYDQGLIEIAQQSARREDFVLHRGVYAAMLGPNYETRAEYRFLRQIGADVAGMSTVPEVVIARQEAMRVLAISLVANEARPDALESTSGQQVLDAADSAAPRLCSIFESVVQHHR